MNILAATANDEAKDNVYNVAVGDRTTLNELYSSIQSALNKQGVKVNGKLVFQDFRAGDVRHSQADITKAKSNLGYCATHKILDGISKTVQWYIL